MKFQNINKKVKINWMIRRILGVVIFLIPTIITIFSFDENVQLKISIIVLCGLLLIIQILYTFVLPIYQYKKYLYLVKEDEIILMKGVFFQSSYVIPIIQIQDIGYSQGPIQLVLNLATVNVSTAGSNQMIDGLDKEEAKKIVDEIKEKIKDIANKRLDNGDK